MKVEHIIWDNKFFTEADGKIIGLCNITIRYHGTDAETNLLMSGIFCYDGLGRGSFRNAITTIDCNSTGVSGVYLNSVGNFPDRG